eukprot:2373381-Rhodomonas_salina.4
MLREGMYQRSVVVVKVVEPLPCTASAPRKQTTHCHPGRDTSAMVSKAVTIMFSTSGKAWAMSAPGTARRKRRAIAA